MTNFNTKVILLDDPRMAIDDKNQLQYMFDPLSSRSYSENYFISSNLDESTKLTLPIMNGLTTIIGRPGAGKSTLANLIVDEFNANNQFVNKKDEARLNRIGKTLQVDYVRNMIYNISLQNRYLTYPIIFNFLNENLDNFIDNDDNDDNNKHFQERFLSTVSKRRPELAAALIISRQFRAQVSEIENITAPKRMHLLITLSQVEFKTKDLQNKLKDRSVIIPGLSSLSSYTYYNKNASTNSLFYKLSIIESGRKYDRFLIEIKSNGDVNFFNIKDYKELRDDLSDKSEKIFKLRDNNLKAFTSLVDYLYPSDVIKCSDDEFVVSQISINADRLTLLAKLTNLFSDIDTFSSLIKVIENSLSLPSSDYLVSKLIYAIFKAVGIDTFDLKEIPFIHVFTEDYPNTKDTESCVNIVADGLGIHNIENPYSVVSSKSIFDVISLLMIMGHNLILSSVNETIFESLAQGSTREAGLDSRLVKVLQDFSNLASVNEVKIIAEVRNDYNKSSFGAKKNFAIKALENFGQTSTLAISLEGSVLNSDNSEDTNDSGTLGYCDIRIRNVNFYEILDNDKKNEVTKASMFIKNVRTNDILLNLSNIFGIVTKLQY